jgi:antitoxin MazE
MVMKTRIVEIGNSRGIRVSKALLDQAQLPEEVELQAEPGRLIVRGAKRRRAGWAAAARAMRTHGDDRLLDPPRPTSFDEKNGSGSSSGGLSPHTMTTVLAALQEVFGT